MSDLDLDDEDWIDLEPTLKVGLALPEAAVKVTERNGKLRAAVVLRREAAAWAFRNEPRFRVQVGGVALNILRITPDARAGRFEVANCKGAARLLIGRVPVWPAEPRELAKAEWSVVDASMVLILPKDFARAGAATLAMPAPAAPPPKPKPPDPAPNIKVTTAAPGLRAQPLRDPSLPAPGRSALDERLRGATSSLEDMLPPETRRRLEEFRQKAAE